jgi:hypothetical protein
MSNEEVNVLELISVIGFDGMYIQEYKLKGPVQKRGGYSFGRDFVLHCLMHKFIYFFFLHTEVSFSYYVRFLLVQLPGIPLCIG